MSTRVAWREFWLCAFLATSDGVSLLPWKRNCSNNELKLTEAGFFMRGIKRGTPIPLFLASRSLKTSRDVCSSLLEKVESKKMKNDACYRSWKNLTEFDLRIVVLICLLIDSL